MSPSRRRARPTPPRSATDLRPPRYRLLTAAAALPQRPPPVPQATFDRECPACGRTVAFTQRQAADGVEYAVEDHPCA